MGSSLTIAVVGAGLAGLVAAREISRRGHRVIVLESSQRLGGQIFTQHHQGFVIEHGAEGYSPGSRVVTGLLASLGLTDRTVKQVLFDAYRLEGSDLRRLSGGEAASLLGIQASTRASERGVVSLKEGMGEVIHRLAREVAARGEIRTGAAVKRIERASKGIALHLADGSLLLAGRAVAAVPPEALEAILPDELRGAARSLVAMPAFSSVSVSLAYPADRVTHPLDAAGMVAADGLRSGPGFKACVFSSSKFPGRAPEGWVLLRVFFRPGGEYPPGAPDGWWAERAEESICGPLGIQGSAPLFWVARWERALPLWDQGRVEAARQLRGILRGKLSLELAGSHYRKSGIAGAVRSGLEAARRVASRPEIA